MTTTRVAFSADQQRLVGYVRELARDRGMSPAEALAALRTEYQDPTDGPMLPERWNLTDDQVEQVAELFDRVELAAAGEVTLTDDEWRAAGGRVDPYPTSKYEVKFDAAGGLVSTRDVWADQRAAEPQPDEPAEDDDLVVAQVAALEPPDPKRAGFTRGLREMADFLDQHPEVPLPYLGEVGGRTNRPSLPIYLVSFDDTNREKLATIARAMAAGGRRVHKHADPDDNHPGYYVWCEFGSLALAARADRDQVCERIVVGTENVEVEQDACPECGGALVSTDGATACETDPSHYRARKPGKRVATTEREVVEWRCTPLLADGGEQG